MNVAKEDPRRFDRLNTDAGQALGACGRRKALRYALSPTRLGSSKTRIHQMVAEADPTGWLQRAVQGIDGLARGRDTSPYPAIRVQLVVAEEGRAEGLAPEDLCRRILDQGIPGEARAQAEEDVAEKDLVGAIWPVVFHGTAALSDGQRDAIAAVLRDYLAGAAAELDRQLELMGDAAALLRQVER